MPIPTISRHPREGIEFESRSAHRQNTSLWKEILCADPKLSRIPRNNLGHITVRVTIHRGDPDWNTMKGEHVMIVQFYISAENGNNRECILPRIDIRVASHELSRHFSTGSIESRFYYIKFPPIMQHSLQCPSFLMSRQAAGVMPPAPLRFILRAAVTFSVIAGLFAVSGRLLYHIVSTINQSNCIG